MSFSEDIDPEEGFAPPQIHPRPFQSEEIDPAKVVVSYDRRSDTLLIHLFGRDLDTISVPVARYLYVMVAPDTERVVGFHIEGFLAQAVKDVPSAIDLLDYAELRGITPAEVRLLQREARGARHQFVAYLRSSLARSVQDGKRQAIASFIDAERSRWDLSFIPVVG